MYLGGTTRLQIVDVSDPRQPSELGYVATEFLSRVLPAGQLAVGINRYAAPRVQLFDVTDVISIRAVGLVWRPAEYIRGEAIAPDGRTLFVYTDNALFSRDPQTTVLDISDPLAGPKPIATLDGVGGPLAATDDALYVAQPRGIMVYDMRLRDRPRWVETVELAADTLLLLADGRQLALAGDGWLHLLDLSDPLHPALTRSTAVPAFGDARLAQGGAMLWYWGRGALGWYGFQLR